MLDEKSKFNEMYACLKERFIKLFNENGFKLSEKFDKNIFFLKNKNLFVEEGFTPKGGKNEMIDILEKTSSNGANFTQLDVKVEEFINELSRVIFEYNNHKIKIEENLNKISLKQNLERIGYKYNISNSGFIYSSLNNSRNKRLNNETSVSFYIWNIKGLTEGQFKISLIYKLKSSEEDYSNVKSENILINKISKNIDKPIKIEVILKNQLDDYYDMKIFPIKEYFFEVEKNGKTVFETEVISLDPIIIQYLDKIFDNSGFRSANKEDFEENQDKEENKHSINYNLEIIIEEELKRDILKKAINYYESLVRGIDGLQSKINILLSFFDDKTVKDLEEILKGRLFNSNIDACVCNNCSIF